MKYKIYKLIYMGQPVYVGRTTRTLKERKWVGYSKNIELQKIYKECSIELIEETDDVSRERYWIVELNKSYNLLNKRLGDSGLDTKEWRKQWKKEYYNKNKEILKEQWKEYQINNKEKVSQYQKEYRNNKKELGI